MSNAGHYPYYIYTGEAAPAILGCGKLVRVLGTKAAGYWDVIFVGCGSTFLADPKELAGITTNDRVRYQDTLAPGEALIAVDVDGAEDYLIQGNVYHFSRWANQSTLHLEETGLELGKIGFRPGRFVRDIR